MLKVKFYISAKKTEQANILIRFYNGRNFSFYAVSGKQIKPAYWDNKKFKVRDKIEFIERDSFQTELNELQNYIIKEYNNYHDKAKVNKDWLVKTIDKFNNPVKYIQNNSTSLFGYIQNFINNSKSRINPKSGNPVGYKMRREYEVTFDYLKKFAKELKKEPDFIDIDLEFYNQFVSFLRKENLAINTIGKKIQTLKIFLNDATEQGINKSLKFKSKNFKTLKEASDNIYLTETELKHFYEYDFSNNQRLERVRDLFIVAAWTGGVRFGDWEKITADNIEGEYITLKQNKTGDPVTIPLHNTVNEIMGKYNGKLPDPISNQKFNEYIKEAAKIAELNGVFKKTVSKDGKKYEKKFSKHELISSHTARRSFCTNLYEMGIPILSIMALSGHKSEQAFLKYIKTSAKKHAEIVMKFWQERGDFMKIAK